MAEEKTETSRLARKGFKTGLTGKVTFSLKDEEDSKKRKRTRTRSKAAGAVILC